MEAITFNIGDVVEWSSQAAGVWKTKRGIIRRIETKLPFYGAKNKVQCVEVVVDPAPLKNGKPSTAKPTIYWPRTSALKLIEDK
jgi:hypothetical protein